MPPKALTTPMIAFSQVRDSSALLVAGPLLDPPDPGIPVVAVTVVMSYDGSTWSAKSEYGGGWPV